MSFFTVFNIIGSLTLLGIISFIGYRLLSKINFPASRLVGPILFVALFQMTGYTFEVPSPIKIGCSIVFGVYLGLRFNKPALIRLKSGILPAVALSLIYIVLTLFNGWTLTQLTSMSLYSAFLSVIPGGVAEAGVLAVSYNADLAQVSSFQLLRFLSIVTIVPILTQWVLNPLLHLKQAPLPTQLFDDSDSLSSITEGFCTIDTEKVRCYHALWLFVIGCIGSFVFNSIHFPAALLLGATFAVTCAGLLPNISFVKPSQKYYDWAQIVMGAIIGTSFTLTSLLAMRSLIMPLLIMTIWILISSLLIAYVFTKVFKMDFLTGFFSVLPGGLSTMIVLSESYECDIVMISSLQLMRLVTAVMIIPILYQAILG